MAAKSILGNNLPDSLVDAATGIISQDTDDRQAIETAVLAEFGAENGDELSANDKSRYDSRVFDIKRGTDTLQTLLNEEPVDDADKLPVIGKEKKNGKKKNGNDNDEVDKDDEYNEEEDLKNIQSAAQRIKQHMKKNRVNEDDKDNEDDEDEVEVEVEVEDEVEDEEDEEDDEDEDDEDEDDEDDEIDEKFWLQRAAEHIKQHAKKNRVNEDTENDEKEEINEGGKDAIKNLGDKKAKPFTKDNAKKLNKEATTSDTLLFKGDKVHLGTGSKGGAGVEGTVIEFDKWDVTIKSPNGKTYKGPRKFLTKEQFANDLNHIMEATKAQVEKVFKAGLKKFGAKSPADLSTADKKKLFNWVDSQLKAKNESVDLGEAAPKIKYAKIVKGLRDSQGPFTVVAMKSGKVVDQKATIKSKAMLPIEVNQMVMDNPAATVAIESKDGKILNTFSLPQESLKGAQLILDNSKKKIKVEAVDPKKLKLARVLMIAVRDNKLDDIKATDKQKKDALSLKSRTKDGRDIPSAIDALATRL